MLTPPIPERRLESPLSASNGVQVNTILHGDALDVLRSLPDACVDAVVTDPPYGTTACKWDAVIPVEPLWRELHRVIKPHRAIVLFTSQPFTSVMVASNLKRFRHEWIWQKSLGGGFLNANRAPLKRHESILVFSDGAPFYRPQMTQGAPYVARRQAAGETTFDQSVAGWVTVNKGTRYPTSVLSFASETGLHPTQKPVPLLRYLIRTYTNVGDVVLDFALGSGSTAVAALLEGRHYLGIERESKYVALAERRLLDASHTLIASSISRPKPLRRKSVSVFPQPTLWEATA